MDKVTAENTISVFFVILFLFVLFIQRRNNTSLVIHHHVRSLHHPSNRQAKGERSTNVQNGKAAKTEEKKRIFNPSSFFLVSFHEGMCF